ncbi:type VII secretion target [Saccharomonospora piscinae]|uniref:Excreted virulence factor EspC, type VII ESX diderm n=1 Tax=Saccharomonospora piscinae TaxID=687388 RepID=A0A1V9A230_SACPI|nr:type VII secretion target [Saccharomonospora piscinae]OQO91108.1 hypothetical protein B1813_16595 [Saccharomonospora piscinae]TLW93806.1 hypothetical protein FFT09_10635 [Saccharomonospora piscinae]
MAGGQTVDPGRLDAAGTAYTQVSDDLASAGSKLEAGVSTAQVGRAFSHVASTYSDVIGRYRDCVTTYGERAGELGGKLSQAAKAYEDGEAVSRDMIASKEV